jgi:threonyl-tRNA synthetase
MAQVNVTLPDGSKKAVEAGIRIDEFVKTQIGAGLAKAAVIAKLDGAPVDLSRTIDKDVSLAVFTTRAPSPRGHPPRRRPRDGQRGAEALPGTQVTIGPSSRRFYYDFFREKPFTPEDLATYREGRQRGESPRTCPSCARR